MHWMDSEWLMYRRLQSASYMSTSIAKLKHIFSFLKNTDYSFKVIIHFPMLKSDLCSGECKQASLATRVPSSPLSFSSVYRTEVISLYGPIDDTILNKQILTSAPLSKPQMAQSSKVWVSEEIGPWSPFCWVKYFSLLECYFWYILSLIILSLLQHLTWKADVFLLVPSH